jgi:hypothetical protein
LFEFDPHDRPSEGGVADLPEPGVLEDLTGSHVKLLAKSASSSRLERRVPLVSMSSVMPRASMQVPQQPMSAPWRAQAPIIRIRSAACA